MSGADSVAAPAALTPLPAALQHTPGPWHRNISVKYPVFAGEAPNHKRIATVLHGPIHGVPLDEAEANLRLIAAAPALLDALQDVLRHSRSLIVVKYVKAADRAIAQATGVAP